MMASEVQCSYFSLLGLISAVSVTQYVAFTEQQLEVPRDQF